MVHHWLMEEYSFQPSSFQETRDGIPLVINFLEESNPSFKKHRPQMKEICLVIENWLISFQEADTIVVL